MGKLFLSEEFSPWGNSEEEVNDIHLYETPCCDIPKLLFLLILSLF